MDIETIKDSKNKFLPYLICAYNGCRYITSFGLNQNVLFTEFINNLVTLFENRKRTLIVYAHNLSNFDGQFLMKHLVKFGNVKPISFHGRLISIKVTLSIKGHIGKTIIFKDSMLMLPLSLRQLCDSFKVENKKGVFPYLLQDINYKGQFPNYELFTSISKNEYLTIENQYSDKIWSFKEEAINYCKLDCLSLYEVLSKFNDLIFNEFKVDPTKVLTLPSFMVGKELGQFKLEHTILKAVFLAPKVYGLITDQGEEIIKVKII
jgi:DNA polymerase family B